MRVLLLRYLPYLAGLAGLLGGLWWVHHHGYRVGQDERTAHYQPLLAAIDQERIVAEARVRTITAAQDALAVEVEHRYAETEKTLRARADGAERAYARILSDGARRRAGPEPATAAAPAEPSGPAGIDQCTGELAASFRTLAERAVRDADRLAELQQFYESQRALLAH